MSAALVTGGSGFLGHILIARLLQEGHEVTNIDLLPCDLAHPRLLSFVGDIRDRPLLDRALAARDHDTVYHCAALLAHGDASPKAVWDNNVDGTAAVAETVAARGIRSVVYLSSNCLWGTSFPRPVTEDDAPAPIEDYGDSKWQGEKILARYGHQFATTVLRCPTIVDAGRLGLLTILFDFIAEGRRVWVVGDGSNRYQFIYAQDLLAAMLIAGRRAHAGVYGIGSDAVPTMRQLYEHVIAQAGTGARVACLPKTPTIAAMQLAHMMGVSPLGPYHYRMIASDFVFDTSRIKRDLDWRPTLTNQDMLTRAYEAYVNERDAILARRSASAHRQPARMGIIRALKWIS
jgi:UDP-glucose 4-epimerase